MQLSLILNSYYIDIIYALVFKSLAFQINAVVLNLLFMNKFSVFLNKCDFDEQDSLKTF